MIRLSVKKEKRLLNQCLTFTNFGTFFRQATRGEFSHLKRAMCGDYSVCYQVARMTICRSRMLRGFSLFKASKANLVCITLNFLLSGYTVISGGRVLWKRISQWLLFVLGQRGDEHHVSKEHSCFSSMLDGNVIG